MNAVFIITYHHVGEYGLKVCNGLVIFQIIQERFTISNCVKNTIYSHYFLLCMYLDPVFRSNTFKLIATVILSKEVVKYYVMKNIFIHMS